MAGLEVFSGQDHKITVRHVPVLSSPVQIVDSARDLGVVIDSHLTNYGCPRHLGLPRRLLSSAATTPDHEITVRRCSKDARAEFYYLSS